MASRNEQGFYRRVTAVAAYLKTRRRVAIVTNYDADGISAGAVLFNALQRAGVPCSVEWLNQLYPDQIKENPGEKSATAFVDFASRYLPAIQEKMGNAFCVLDHHQPGEHDHPRHLNPLVFGIDGGKEISSSGIAYLVARAMDPANQDLAALAVVGACGDLQDREGKLTGLNAAIAREAVAAGVLATRQDMALYGRITRPLVQYLCFATDPCLPGLTGNEEACKQLLRRLGIPLKKGVRWRAYNDLEEGERKKLVTALVLALHESGAPSWKAERLIGEVYTLVREPGDAPLRDAKEYATLLNACGRHQQSAIAHAVCMGDREKAYAKALALLARHRRALRSGLEWVLARGLRQDPAFYWFDAEKHIADGIVGIVAGMLYAGQGQAREKPIVALARYEDGAVKASARATPALVHAGIDLGKAMKEAAAAVPGAEGGGHAAAAGARVPPPAKDAFLKALSTALQKQRAPAHKPAPQKLN